MSRRASDVAHGWLGLTNESTVEWYFSKLARADSHAHFGLTITSRQVPIQGFFSTCVAP